MFSESEKLSLLYQRQQAGDKRAKELILKEIEDDTKKLFPTKQPTEKINPKDVVVQSTVVFPDGTSKEIVQFADGTSQEKTL